jgi:hypothetical protein
MAFSVECLTGHSARENPMRTKRFSARFGDADETRRRRPGRRGRRSSRCVSSLFVPSAALKF